MPWNLYTAFISVFYLIMLNLHEGRSRAREMLQLPERA
jgi:hypothetical protein